MKTKVKRGTAVVTISMTVKQAQMLHEMCNSINGCGKGRDFAGELGDIMYEAVGFAEREYFHGELEAV